MEIGSIASMATGMAQAKTAQDVSIAVFKKALDAQSDGAMALLQAIPQVPSTRLPVHLGRNINTVA
ncbi:putative motility protein [Noviherbaspirillum sedimenti]|uniref:Putative motility protein n=2 Tax=Noviherbaspirillum sedimenti TaxID=2320865 RepID=A0A3A3GJG2_9BURK|nr:putative motility protein [Noviherbaspirillum sedimenti]